MEGTRAKILNLLQREGSATVDSLAKSLGLTSATVRRHLDILQRDRLISYREVRKKTGRPEYSFSLTEGGHEALPKHYHRMLSLMLREMSSLTPEAIQGKTGPEILTIVFQRIAQQEIRQYGERLDGKSPKERVSTLLKVLEDQDFVPEVEEADGVVRIRLLNCPFRYAALDNNAVCIFDHSLISSILQAPVRRETWVQQGDHCCTYIVNISREKAAASAS